MTSLPLLRARRQWLAWAVAACVAPLGAHAQAPTPRIARARRDPRVAAPFLTPTQFVRAALALHFLPAARAFEASSLALAASLEAGCADIHAARGAWRSAMLDWERLSAVAVGPLIERRAARALDFWPARPAMIDPAVRSAPTAVTELDRIGAPAKGLPALEWLLWQGSADAAACRYAALLARECANEATALRTGFDALAAREWDDEAALPVLHDWIGQTVGGIEQLRWKKIGKPARAGKKGDWPRTLSGNTRAAWAAHWEGLARMLLGTPAGEEQGSLNGLLRARGHLRISAQLEALLARAGAAITAADPARPATLAAAQQALARSKALVEDKAAGALQITVGFSDADGD